MSEKPNGSIRADIASEIAQAPQPLNLMRYDAARAALAEAYRVDEVKDIHDKAVAHVPSRAAPGRHYLSESGNSAFVEHLSARPGEGPTGAFAFGRARGVVEGVLAAAKIPVIFITPPSWKRAILLPTETHKDWSRSAAIRRLPDKAELFQRVKDDGRSDAALIGVVGLIRAGKLK